MSDSAAAGPSFSFARRAYGVLALVGADRVDLLHRLSTQDLRPLRASGQVAQTLFTTAQGRALAWTQIISLPDALMLVCPLVQVARLTQWIATYTIMEDVEVTDVTDAWAIFEVFGARGLDALGVSAPVSAQKWQPLSGLGAGQSAVMGLSPALGAGAQGLVHAPLWPKLQMQLEQKGGSAANAQALELLRIRAGVPSGAIELTGEPNPLEMRLGAACISWNKGCYIGQEVISRLDSYNKVARLLMGFTAHEPLADPGEAGHKLFVDERPIGRVTSWVSTAQGSVGLALVKRTHAQPGQAQLRLGERTIDIALEDRPFWA